MKKRSILFYWLLIFFPALIISISAFQLLSHEQERINRMAVASAEDRARTIGETLQITVEAVEDELLSSLREIPERDLENTLLGWEQSNPLIRNVFIWDRHSGLKYPASGLASTSEERQFIIRFDGLFSGRISWPLTGSYRRDILPAPGQPTLTGPAAAEKKASGLLQDLREFKTGRQELVQIAKGKNIRLDKSITKTEFSETGGWIPWFAENKLYILGWVKTRESGPVYGVELELVTLLSRLITRFPSASSEGFVYALRDDAGQLLHQSGTAPIDAGAVPDISISLAPHLPHWEIVVYGSDKKGLVRSEKGFLVLAGLLLMIFMAAIIIGGSLLTWQAHRNMKDALQKTSFVSNVSHELKTPLTSIRMYAELLFEGRIKDPDKKKTYLQVIVSESQRLTRLVNNVLDFSRLEQGRKTYHPQKIDLNEFLMEVVDSHRLRIKEAGMTIDTHFLGEKIFVNADRDAIEQVFINLIDNSIKYAGPGIEVVVSVNKNGKDCEIRIEDRGPGVPEADRHKIFEKFHRVDDTLTSKQQGSGLGLSIARKISRDLGGNLVYESRDGGGSCFIVRLPYL
ncbi:ATPase/histidine kinase/DNA gyrase B/HSP90 domain protein [delta proteobacterium NaphS2]|nr:ATPase/histidine kinase/DNA gyrase B/HSP90 domain protein [delta proteobacterium NaphS2]